MRRLALIIFMAIVPLSCNAFQNNITISQVKQNLNCLEFREGIQWKEAVAKIGEPDIAPFPEPGTDLSVNTRVYNNITIIFHTKRQEFKEEGKTRFMEVVDRIEVCRTK